MDQTINLIREQGPFPQINSTDNPPTPNAADIAGAKWRLVLGQHRVLLFDDIGNEMMSIPRGLAPSAVSLPSQDLESNGALNLGIATPGGQYYWFRPNEFALRQIRDYLDYDGANQFDDSSDQADRQVPADAEWTDQLQGQESTPRWSSMSEQSPAPTGPSRLRRLVVWLVIICGASALYAWRDDIFGRGLGVRLEVTPLEEIYYRHVTEADARHLGQVLRELEAFDGNSRKTLTLSKKDGNYAIGFVVKEGSWNDADARLDFRLLAMQLSARVFSGEPVWVRLLDENSKQKHAELVTADLGTAYVSLGAKDDMDEVYYSDVTEEKARAFLEAIKQFAVVNNAKRRTHTLSRKDNHYALGFFVAKEASNADGLDSFRLWVMELSARVFNGEPTWIRLFDDRGREKPSQFIKQSLGSWLALGPKEDVYYRGVTEDQARKVGVMVKQVLNTPVPAPIAPWPPQQPKQLLPGFGPPALPGMPNPLNKPGPFGQPVPKIGAKFPPGVGQPFLPPGQPGAPWPGMAQQFPGGQRLLPFNNQLQNQDSGLFVSIARETDAVSLTCMVVEGAWNDNQLVQDLQALGQRINTEVLNSELTEVHIADTHLRVKKTMRIR